jgi:hypothetical protein
MSLLSRRLIAEGLGSMLLAATVIGSGVMGEHLAGGNVAVALLANTGATGCNPGRADQIAGTGERSSF